MLTLAWHHMIVDSDEYAHTFGMPMDCFCEPEIDLLGEDRAGIEHRVVRHQDMRRSTITEDKPNV